MELEEIKFKVDAYYGVDISAIVEIRRIQMQESYLFLWLVRESLTVVKENTYTKR